MENFLNNFGQIKGCSFVSVKGYTSVTNGEVSNFLINVGVNYENMVHSDIKTLSNASFDDALMEEARIKLLTALKNNLDPEKRSNQSKAQRDLYFSPNKGIAMHVKKQTLYVVGVRVSKTVLKKGEYKKVNSRPLTLAQNKVKKELDLKTSKYRKFYLPKIKGIKMKGKEFIISTDNGEITIS